MMNEQCGMFLARSNCYSTKSKLHTVLFDNESEIIYIAQSCIALQNMKSTSYPFVLLFVSMIYV